MAVKTEKNKESVLYSPLNLNCTLSVIKKKRGGGCLIKNPVVFSKDSE